MPIQKQEQGKENVSAASLVYAIEELQKVAADAGKPYLVWLVFEELMHLSSIVKENEKVGRKQEKES